MSDPHHRRAPLTKDSDMWDVKLLAAHLGLHLETVRRNARENKYPGAQRWGGQWRFPNPTKPDPLPALPLTTVLPPSDI